MVIGPLSGRRCVDVKPEEWLLARRWLWVPLTLVVCVVFGPAFLDVMTPKHLKDFLQEWTSARNLFAGLPIYENQEVALRHHMGLTRRPGEPFPDWNAHPPTSVLLAVPFAWLDYWHAIVAWNVVSLFCLGWSIWLILRELDLPYSLWTIFPIVALVLVCGACGVLRSQLREGQLNLVLLLLCTGTWAADRRGNAVLAGALLGTATAIKLFPGFLFLYFLLQRRWRTLALGVVACCIWTQFTAAILGVEAYSDYCFDVMPTLINHRSLWTGVSIYGFFSKLFDPYLAFFPTAALYYSPGFARVATVACCMAVVAVSAGTIYRARTTRQRDLAFGLCVIAMLLLSPLAWEHCLVMLVLPVLLLWTALPPTGISLWALRLITAMLFVHHYCYWFVFLCDPRQDWSGVVPRPWQTLTALSFHFYALVGLFVLGVYAVRQARATEVVKTCPVWTNPLRLTVGGQQAAAS
jgi:Glycosyltransferase family 87